MTRLRLGGLWDLLACPRCREPVRPRGDGLACTCCGRRYPIVDGVPVLLPEGRQPLPPDTALPVHDRYDDWIPRTVLDALPPDAVSLEVGAGRMAASHANVIRLDVTLTPHVDVVGDAHALPLRTGLIDFVFSHAVLEHLRQPFVAAAEMERVLRPGGYVYGECAFVFPFHGHPDHYFNASHLGLAELFHAFTPLRAGVAPYQMPSFALQALLETYRFFLAPHPDPDARRACERLDALLGEDLAALDARFSQEAALRCAACTYFFGVRAPEATQVIPAPLLAAHRSRAALRERFPNPLDLGAPNNLLAWARTDEGRREPGVATALDTCVPFRKDAPPIAIHQARETNGSRWRTRLVDAARAARRRLARRARNGREPAAWTVEGIIDDGERVTHLFPNDCYVAHLSLYHFALPLVRGARVLDAGSGSGYGAAYLADHDAAAVLGIDASSKAVEFSRQHFTRPNLRFDVMRLTHLESLQAGGWDIVFCSNVLEHVSEVGGFLRGVWRLLAPSGVLVVAVPPVVNDALRAQNLANPYHLNIWSPRQWAHVLGGYFAEVQAFQHWYDKPGVELNLLNSPAETVIQASDFVFRPVAPAELYTAPTISAVFTARRPVEASRLPAAGRAPEYVDDSFTRPLPVAASPARG